MLLLRAYLLKKLFAFELGTAIQRSIQMDFLQRDWASREFTRGKFVAHGSSAGKHWACLLKPFESSPKVENLWHHFCGNNERLTETG